MRAVKLLKAARLVKKPMWSYEGRESARIWELQNIGFGAIQT
jgi:hypothetical protein